MKILCIDTYYPAFLSSLPQMTGKYEDELSSLLSLGFGTFDAYSFYLRAEGHDVVDVIANYEPLQRLWARENAFPDGIAWTMSLETIMAEQVERFRPDVIFLQDAGHISTSMLQLWKSEGYMVAAQCSCALSPRVDVASIDVIFTSLPTHISGFKRFTQAEYLPLAFDPRMTPVESERDIDISFVGGVGRESHWMAGTDVLEEIAKEFGPRFHWYGYGIENLKQYSALRACFRGSAFGKEMYSIYGRSRIVVNRHGEIAQGFTNNLRCFEATGCGALLMTEKSYNSENLFPVDTVGTYRDAKELISKIHHFLNNEAGRRLVAKFGQIHTLTHHTYDIRMKTVSSVLSDRLSRREVRA